MKMTHRELAGRFEALRELGARFAPTMTSDLRVSRLLRPIAKAWEPLATEKARIYNRLTKEAIEKNGVKSIEDLPQSTQRILLNEISFEQREWDKQEVEVEMPENTRLTQNDLPKERAGDEGWKNGTGLGGLVAELGDELFEQPKE